MSDVHTEYFKKIINFSHPCTKVTIDSSCITEDGFEVSNLISNNPSFLSKGFLAARFIKPPVFITLNFGICINIIEISFCCKNECQCSVGFEIFTSPCEHVNNGASVEWKKIISFTTCGENQVILKNMKMKNVKIPFKNYFNTLENDQKEFYSQKYKEFFSVAKLKIGIFKVARSGIPCLKLLSIWGLPTSHCNKEIVKEIWISWSFNIIKKKNKDVSMKAVQEIQSCKKQSSDTEIPEEFIDPITCDIMVVPMLLPSGKNIDRTTLERVNKEQQLLGQNFSDPFTGLPFTKNLSPILNVALKSRIDFFHFQWSVKGTQIKGPRTIGREHFEIFESVSSSFSDNSSLKTSRNIDTDLQHANHLLPTTSSHSKLESSESLSVDAHLKSLESTLEDALKTFCDKDQSLSINCVFCGKQEVAYVLRCQHYACQSCLRTGDKKTVCFKCDVLIQSKDVQRFHNFIVNNN